jgi:hypothetical protein
MASCRDIEVHLNPFVDPSAAFVAETHEKLDAVVKLVAGD